MASTNPSAAAAPKTYPVAAAPAPLSTAAGAPEAPSAAAALVMLSADGGTETVPPLESWVHEPSLLGHTNVGQTSMGSWAHVPSSDQHWCAMNSRGSVVAL